MKPFKFGPRSISKLETCTAVMQRLATRALEVSPYDFSIVHGFRDEYLQTLLYESGAGLPWPKSKHNILDAVSGKPCSEAIDFGPWVKGNIPWKETYIFCVIAGCFFAAAHDLGIQIRWGGDWDGDGSTKDQKLSDLGHIELVR